MCNIEEEIDITASNGKYIIITMKILNIIVRNELH